MTSFATQTSAIATCDECDRAASVYEAHLRYLESVITEFSLEDRLPLEGLAWYNMRVKTLLVECNSLWGALHDHQMEHLTAMQE